MRYEITEQAIFSLRLAWARRSLKATPARILVDANTPYIDFYLLNLDFPSRKDYLDAAFKNL